MGMVRLGARQEKTGGEAPAPLLLSSPALPALFMPIAVFDDGKFLFLTYSAGQFRQFSGQPYAILLLLGKSELLSTQSILADANENCEWGIYADFA
jgi:hypothetical protein